MKRIKIGVIGVGYLGKFHAEKYSKMGGVELVGVTDIHQGNAQEIAAKLGTRAFNDKDELIKAVDAVSIVVPTSKHFEVAMACLEGGLDIFIEKPMTTTVAQADAILEKAASCNRLVQVGHIERFNPAILAMEQYINNPVFIETQRFNAYNPRGTDVDVVLDLMIHDIDVVLSVVDSPLKTMHSVGAPIVSATSDIANTRLVFENGCSANISVSRVARGHGDDRRVLRIFQAESYITVDYVHKTIEVVRPLPGTKNSGAPQEEVIQLSFPEKDSLETELKAFVLNVKERTRPKVDGEAGRRALRVALQVIEQMERQRLEHPTLYTIS